MRLSHERHGDDLAQIPVDVVDPVLLRDVREIADPCDPAGTRGGGRRQRRKLVEAWAAYCGQADVASNVDGQAAAQSETTDAETTRHVRVPNLDSSLEAEGSASQ
jgi:hypothetical protein